MAATIEIKKTLTNYFVNNSTKLLSSYIMIEESVQHLKSV